MAECNTKGKAFYIHKAQSLIPRLIYTEEKPVNCTVYKNGVKKTGEEALGKAEECGKGEVQVWDFGNNHAAYFEFFCKSVGSPMDAPAFFHFKFCETEKEIWEDTQNYSGWISSGWLQEEWMHVDCLPRHIRMERRYAFRYVKITILDTSQKFRVVFYGVTRKKVSSVMAEAVTPVCTEQKLLREIDAAAVRTLGNCMQTVFEDGPKRDRRLWMGDLRLQALVNYETFQKNDLVKRCLYLFAGLTDEWGRIPASVFESPMPLGDDGFLLDYGLFFVCSLVEYYEAANDRETLLELAPCALRQIEIALTYTDKNGIVCRESGMDSYFCFIDWNEKLDKQCAMQGVILYTLRFGAKLCRYLGMEKQAEDYDMQYERMKIAAGKVFWDNDAKVFVCGSERQVSAASQVWMILGGVISGREAAGVLERIRECPITMVTPYMNHFYVMALLEAGEKERAFDHIKTYWGGMILAGADTFWELYNPENEKESPYGSDCVNSYCHAWSCTPAYLMRKFLKDLL